MPNWITISVAATILAVSTGSAFALKPSDTPHKVPMQHGEMKHGQMQHSEMKHGEINHDQMAKPANLPKEPGQGAFATIAEIVTILTNDPKTDWRKVDINALREHLIDMDEVSLRAKATMKQSGNSITFTVTGTGRTLKAIQSMVPAHSAVLDRTTQWQVKAEVTANGAIMTVTAKNMHAAHIVKALGFFGVMATGAHHQAHHLSMAKGDRHVHAHN